MPTDLGRCDGHRNEHRKPIGVHHLLVLLLVVAIAGFVVAIVLPRRRMDRSKRAALAIVVGVVGTGGNVPAVRFLVASPVLGDKRIALGSGWCNGGALRGGRDAFWFVVVVVVLLPMTPAVAITITTAICVRIRVVGRIGNRIKGTGVVSERRRRRQQ